MSDFQNVQEIHTQINDLHKLNQKQQKQRYIIENNYHDLITNRNYLDNVKSDFETINEANYNSQLILTQYYSKYISFLFVTIFLIIILFRFSFNSDQKGGGNNISMIYVFLILFVFIIGLLYYVRIINQ
jgi:ATP-dependent Zn protease